MDLVPYQLDPGRQALSRPRQRILVGLVPFPELLQRIGIGKRPSPIEACWWTRKFCAACCRTP